MVSSRAPCSWRASSRWSATPTAPKPATRTVDPSRTPATASAVVFTRLSITSKPPLALVHNTLGTGDSNSHKSAGEEGPNLHEALPRPAGETLPARKAGITMTPAAKIVVAKSCPRASNQNNQKTSGGTRVYSQIDGKRQDGLGRRRGPHPSSQSPARPSEPDRYPCRLRYQPVRRLCR